MTVKLLNHYNFNEPIDPEEAERAIRGFIRQVKNKELPSPELMEFIAEGLQKQYMSDDISNWAGRGRGRPATSASDSLNMLAWYLFNIDEEFCTQPKTLGTGRYINIAEQFSKAAAKYNLENHEKYQMYHLAEIFSKKQLINLKSESSVKRAVVDFQTYGLDAEETTLHNQTIIETFCIIILKKNGDEATNLKKIIWEKWIKNQVQK